MASSRSAFRVVGGRDFPAQQSLAEARRRARPLLNYWLRKVERAVVDKKLQPVDYLMAKELTNYPSANQGRCYPGQTRLGKKLGICDRTARRSLKRLCNEGLLQCKRGGPGRTASWTFCFNKTPIFGGPMFSGSEERSHEAALSAPDQTPVSDLERTPVSDKPYEPDPFERKPFPPTPQRPCGGDQQANAASLGEQSWPPATEPQAAMRHALVAAFESGCPKEALHGEVLGPEISFADFWNGTRRHSSSRDKEGWARAAWKKLSREDRCVLGTMMNEGRIDLNGMYTGNWLANRVWEEPALCKSGILGALDRIDDSPIGAASRRVQTIHTPAYSELWHAEHARLLKVGDRMQAEYMETRAKNGDGWTCSVEME
jgi:hypothetical protein